MAVPERRHSMLKLREPKVKTTTPASDSSSLDEGELSQLNSGHGPGETSALVRKINDIQKTWTSRTQRQSRKDLLHKQSQDWKLAWVCMDYMHTQATWLKELAFSDLAIKRFFKGIFVTFVMICLLHFCFYLLLILPNNYQLLWFKNKMGVKPNNPHLFLWT